MAKMYTGPYEVIKQLGPLNYVIRKCNGRQEIIAHVDKMKPYLGQLHDTRQDIPDTQRDTTLQDISDHNDTNHQDVGTYGDQSETVDNPPTSGVSPRPLRSREVPDRYTDFVLFTRKKTNRPQPSRPAPTLRPCKYCGVELRGKREQLRHVQSSHRDILATNKERA